MTWENPMIPLVQAAAAEAPAAPCATPRPHPAPPARAPPGACAEMDGMWLLIHPGEKTP